MKLSINDVDVTGASVDQTGKLCITYKHIFVFKEGSNVEGMDASELALDILEAKKDQENFIKKLRKTYPKSFSNISISGITNIFLL